MIRCLSGPKAVRRALAEHLRAKGYLPEGASS